MAKAHSPLGASSAHRWMACPGSYRVAQAVTTPGAPSVYAAQGTLAHQIAEHILMCGGPPDRNLGQTFDIEGHLITVDQDMVEAIETYLRTVDPIIHRSSYWAAENNIELTSYWRPGAPPVPLFGTADLIAYWKKYRRLTVVDYKHGAGIYVSHIDNPQPYYYAAGAMALCEANYIDMGDVSEVEMIIVQPRLPNREAVRSIVVPAIDILMWVETELKPAVARTQQPDAPLVMGDHCRFCPGRVICPAMQQLRLDAAKRAFGPVTEGVKDASDADIGEYLDDIDKLEIWIDATRDEARTRIDAGGRIPGWGLVPTRPHRVWSDEDHVARDLHRLGYTPGQIYAFAVHSPAQMQKHVQPDTWRDLQSLIDVRSSGTKLARSLNPRPDPTTQFEATQETEAP